MTYETKLKIIIQQLREDRDRLLDAIDKISDEVNKLKKVSDGNKVYVGINDVLDIIDKYR